MAFKKLMSISKKKYKKTINILKKNMIEKRLIEIIGAEYMDIIKSKYCDFFSFGYVQINPDELFKDGDRKANTIRS